MKIEKEVELISLIFIVSLIWSLRQSDGHSGTVKEFVNYARSSC